MRAPQVVVDDFGVQFELVRDAFVWFGVQIQDGDGIRKTRLFQIQLMSVNTKQIEGKMTANVEANHQLKSENKLTPRLLRKVQT